MNKTNAMRLLDKAKIKYEAKEYSDEITSAVEVASVLNEDPKVVFKTLVTCSNKSYFVFIIPAELNLNLKKAAKSANVKAIELIKQKELLPLTGYVHGGCSPIGMKKKFPTFIDQSVLLNSEIYISGGKIGVQIHIHVKDLISFCDLLVDDLCDDNK